MSKEESKRDHEKKDSESPEMDFLNSKYEDKKPAISENVSEAQKEMMKTKKELDKLKSFIIKKYPFTQAIGILPPQSIKMFIDEEEVPKETEKFIHLYMIIPEEKFKESPKIKAEIVKKLEEVKSEQKIWVQVKTSVDVWENCLDSKFTITEAIGMSYPIFDKGILGALRVASIHKSLVLQKFEKYVVSYVIGGSLVRGEAQPTSDVDVFIVINDTDVKRMPRLELKERLRGIIYQYIQEATVLAGVKNVLSPQVYLLTEFWESVKDAHPVIFTFIRDGIPLYDRGTFMPWKALLRMGKLKPSPEAVDMFMSMGDGVISRSKKIMLSDIFTNIFWGITTPAQALLMMNGCPPPNAKKELVPMFKKEFFETKMIEKKYVDFIEKVVKIWRDYEHELIKEISGKEIDQMLVETEDYLKRLKELREQIEKKAKEKTVSDVYNDLIKLLEVNFGKKSPNALVDDFEKQLVKTGKMSPQHFRILNEIISTKADFKKNKLNSQKVDDVRKNASILINDLMELTQRKDLVNLEKGRMQLKYTKDGKEQIAELLNCEGISFLFVEKNVRKILPSEGKIENSTIDEVNHAVEKQKSKHKLEINHKLFELLKKELGDFELSL